MPQLIADYRQKLAKAEEAERKQQLKRKELTEEIRDHFGFDLDPKDPRFQQYQLEKEEKEKNLKKKMKKMKKKIIQKNPS